MRGNRQKKGNKRERGGGGGGDQFARIWGMMDQQNDIISEQKAVIAEQKGEADSRTG
jgi:hypothetical protein